MKKFLIKIIIVFLFILNICFIFDTDSFGFVNDDCITAFNVADKYAKENNITYYDYVVTNEGSYIYVYLFVNEDFVFNKVGNTICCNYCHIFIFTNNDLTNFSMAGDPTSKTNSYTRYAIVYCSFETEIGTNLIPGTEHKIDFKINLSNTDYTSEPIIAYTNYFPMDLLHKYKVYISTDMEEWNLMNYSTLTNAETGVTEFRFNYKIFENGVYYFKFLDLESNESEYITYTITTIFNDREEEDTSDNIPIVHANYKKCYRNEEELFHIYTQGFSISDIQKYECYYIKDHFTTNYSVWNKMDLSSLYDVEKDETTYHFYFHTPIDSENCTYYFVLYDYEKNEYGGYSTLKCDFNYMNMYVNDNFVDSDLNADTIEDNKTIGFYRQTTIYKFFKNNFGLLFFPIDMTFEFFERLSLIKEESPMINVPTIYEPFTGGVLIKGFIFNLNDVLVNETIANIYNIYLVFVDFILYTLFFVFVYRIFKDFANLGGGL